MGFTNSLGARVPNAASALRKVGVVAKSMVRAMHPVGMVKGLVTHGADSIKYASTKDYKKAGLASMKFLGTAAGATYATRAISGRNVFRDKSGKRDFVPWMPFI